MKSKKLLPSLWFAVAFFHLGAMVSLSPEEGQDQTRNPLPIITYTFAVEKGYYDISKIYIEERTRWGYAKIAHRGSGGYGRPTNWNSSRQEWKNFAVSPMEHLQLESRLFG
jgi:hypothetical protein